MAPTSRGSRLHTTVKSSHPLLEHLRKLMIPKESAPQGDPVPQEESAPASTGHNSAQLSLQEMLSLGEHAISKFQFDHASHPLKVKVYHDTAIAKFEILRLSPRSHNPADLFDTLQKFLSLPCVAAIQAQTIGEFKRNRDLYERAMNLRETNTLLQTYYDYFDCIFFYGSLRNKCPVSFVDRPCLQDVSGRQLLGVTLCSPQDPMFPTAYNCEIQIALNVEGFEGSKLEKNLAILLHEMLHAYFDIHVRGMGRCGDLKREGLDPFGHGQYWELAAREIQRRAFYWLGMRLDLEIERSCLENTKVSLVRR